MKQPTLKIRLYGDPCLVKKSKPVKEIGPGERMLFESMIHTMYEAKGVGLAAPQVGINARFFVCDIGDGPMVFVNPEIVKSVGSSVMEEGCLSIPKVNVDVVRPEKITLEYMDHMGKKKKHQFDGLLARVILHETDHLDGKLIVDYMTAAKKKEAKPVLEALKKNFKK